jgi:hypothetical protein
MMKQWRVLAAAAAVTAGLAVPAAAMAGVTGSAGTTDGMAGYTGTQLGTAYRSMTATWDLTPIAQNVGTTTSLASPQGAEGQQLCANGTGVAAEEGTVYNGGTPGTFSVAFAFGKLPVSTADPCRNNGILHNGGKLHPLLSNLPVGDTVTGLIIEERHSILFAAQDAMNGQSFETQVSCGGHWAGSRHHRHYVYAPCPRFNEPGAGVIQNLMLLGGPASFDLVDFTGVDVSTARTSTPGTPLGTLNDITVRSSGTGVAPWLVGPASSTVLGPNGEGCVASLTTVLQTPNLTATGPQYGPLLPGGTQFSVCAAAPIGA